MYDRIHELLDQLNAANRSLNKRVVRRRNLYATIDRLDKMKETIDKLENEIRLEIIRQETLGL